MQDQDTKPFLSVPNWDEMQHYKDRSPPWIKLQNELLENYEFECLHDASKAHLLCIWLLASRTGNKINPDPKWIARKIGANSKVDVESLIQSGFLQLNQPLPSVEHDASKALQTSEQDAIPEGEGEGEESRERVENNLPTEYPGWLNKISWREFEQHRKDIKKPLTDLAKTKLLNTLSTLDYTSQDECISRSIENGWAGLFPNKIKGGNNGRSKQYNRNRGEVGRINDTIDARARERARIEDLQSGRGGLHKGGVIVEKV